MPKRDVYSSIDYDGELLKYYSSLKPLKEIPVIMSLNKEQKAMYDEYKRKYTKSLNDFYRDHLMTVLVGYAYKANRRAIEATPNYLINAERESLEEFRDNLINLPSDGDTVSPENKEQLAELFRTLGTCVEDADLNGNDAEKIAWKKTEREFFAAPGLKNAKIDGVNAYDFAKEQFETGKMLAAYEEADKNDLNMAKYKYQEKLDNLREYETDLADIIESAKKAVVYLDAKTKKNKNDNTGLYNNMYNALAELSRMNSAEDAPEKIIKAVEKLSKACTTYYTERKPRFFKKRKGSIGEYRLNFAKEMMNITSKRLSEHAGEENRKKAEEKGISLNKSIASMRRIYGGVMSELNKSLPVEKEEKEQNPEFPTMEELNASKGFNPVTVEDEEYEFPEADELYGKKPFVPVVKEKVNKEMQPEINPVVQPVVTPEERPVVQPVAQPVAQPVVQPIAQPVVQPIAQQEPEEDDLPTLEELNAARKNNKVQEEIQEEKNPEDIIPGENNMEEDMPKYEVEYPTLGEIDAILAAVKKKEESKKENKAAGNNSKNSFKIGFKEIAKALDGKVLYVPEKPGVCEEIFFVLNGKFLRGHDKNMVGGKYDEITGEVIRSSVKKYDNIYINDIFPFRDKMDCRTFALRLLKVMEGDNDMDKARGPKEEPKTKPQHQPSRDRIA